MLLITSTISPSTAVFSLRGGRLSCEDRGERVSLAGRAVHCLLILMVEFGEHGNFYGTSLRENRIGAQ